jgi:hypothetical protein
MGVMPTLEAIDAHREMGAPTGGHDVDADVSTGSSS